MNGGSQLFHTNLYSKKATFDTKKMTAFLNGGEEVIPKRDFIKGPIDEADEFVADMYNWDRPTLVSKHAEHFIGIHKKFKNYKYVTLCIRITYIDQPDKKLFG
jgi:hypothetical protein